MVSFIVPVYNSENSILDCIKSILNQSYNDIEVIVIDDGSRDFSGKIIRQLQLESDKIRFFSHKNHGVSYTRNRGIELARGQFIQFVDSDDTIDMYMTEQMMKKMEEDKLDLCMCLFKYEHKSLKNIPAFSLDIKSAIDLYFEMLLDNVLLQGPCNKLYKRELLENIRFPLDVSKLEDSIFNSYYLGNCRRIGLIEKAYYRYNYNGESLSHSIHKNEIGALIQFYKIMIENIAFDADIKRRICLYAIKQIEATYRVTWIQLRKEKNDYKNIWNCYENDMKTGVGYRILDPYVSCMSIKNKIFYYLMKHEKLRLMICYFQTIELIKRMVRR